MAVDVQQVSVFLSTAVAAAASAFVTFRSRDKLEREREQVEDKLRGAVFGPPDVRSEVRIGSQEGAEGAERELPLAAQQRIDDDRFAELLVQRYAYGLTQSQRSFLTSQVFSVLGGGVLLTGVGLAIWRAETSGDLYAAIVTTTAGIVTTVIGRLFHRESDKALKHMASETDALRDDMRAERSAEQAILLLAEVDDPEIKARLQAGLIMRFAGSEMPAVRDAHIVPASRDHAESLSREQ
ncbi:hypothetical protein ACFUCT_23275 [Streptomyces parvus]|uniref:TRADD-N-associated membrane domain-containing protein n=1 Tax=Streptomyces parvus TaxID=66428 RepID=UPI0036280CA5